jgi:V8-like Glu-specific endopeptidase
MKFKLDQIAVSVAAITFAVSVQANTLGEADEGITSASADMQSATLMYWDEYSLATAPAIEMPVDFGTGEVDTAALDVEVSSGPPGIIKAGRAEKGANKFHKQAYSEAWAKLAVDWGAEYLALQGESPEAVVDAEETVTEEPVGADVTADTMAGTSGVHTYYDVNAKTALWKLYPHKWDGKFTFTTPSGNASCSATAIRNNHIVTAAHCVYDTGSNRWYTNKAFTPAYRNGAAPYGTFPTAGCRVLTAWVNHSGSYSINSWARDDVAVCRMGVNSAGKTLNQAVGWAGYGWNWDYTQLHFNSGYPARNYNDALLSSPAQYLRSCTAESFKQTTDTLGGGCYYGRGISGGSWIRGYKANYVTGWVNSVNSGLYLGQANLYGARFTSNNIKALCDANGC